MLSEAQRTQATLELVQGLIDLGAITADRVLPFSEDDHIPEGFGPMDVLLDVNEKEEVFVKTTPKMWEKIQALFGEGEA